MEERGWANEWDGTNLEVVEGDHFCLIHATSFVALQHNSEEDYVAVRLFMIWENFFEHPICCAFVTSQILIEWKRPKILITKIKSYNAKILTSKRNNFQLRHKVTTFSSHPPTLNAGIVYEHVFAIVVPCILYNKRGDDSYKQFRILTKCSKTSLRYAYELAIVLITIYVAKVIQMAILSPFTI